MKSLLILSALPVPGLLLGLCAAELHKRRDAFADFTDGAAAGLRILGRLLPTLCGLLVSISMLRASGALDALARLLSPLTEAAGLPAECLPLFLLRPFSGGASLGLATEVIRSAGADSLAGRVAAVLLGGSETTFYTACVYLSAAGVKKSRYVIAAGLIGDLTAMVLSVVTARLFWA